jgi:hypothetical protein
MDERCYACGELPHKPAFPSILEDPSWGNPHTFKPTLEAEYPYAWIASVRKWTPQELIALLNDEKAWKDTSLGGA